MKECQLTTRYIEVDPAELPDSDRRLIETAKEMTRSSYAPWSKFMVGAAIELEDGTIVKGSNQENVAFPSGTCAERSACYWAGANHPGKRFRKIAIAARNLSGENPPEKFEDQFTAVPTAPCGACRQALLEYETLSGPIEVILYGKDKTIILPSVASTLPFCFSEF